MTLNDLGNIGELLGALGVIASLVYLAIQIRQNTRALKASGYQAILAATVRRDVAIVENADVARLVLEGLSGGRLSPEDFIRFQIWMQSILRFFDSMYYQYRNSTLDAEHWETHLVSLRAWLDRPVFRPWWQAFCTSFTPTFQDLVARELQRIDQRCGDRSGGSTTGAQVDPTRPHR